MKKSNIFKLLLVCMVMVLIVVLVLSYSRSTPDGEVVSTTGQKETEAEEYDDPSESDDPLIIFKPDYDGYAFTFLVQDYKDEQYNLVSECKSSYVLPDAVYRRNKILKDKYNINFELMRVTDLVATVRTQVLGGACSFDMIIGDGRKLAALAKENLLYDLSAVKYFDMTKSYWDSNAAEQLKIYDKLYFTNCDINVSEFGNVVYFNKQLIVDYDLTSPYEYLENNQWTLDNWASLVMAVSDNIDGESPWDDVWDEYDIYGTTYEFRNTAMFMYGAGIRATANDGNGGLKVTLYDTDKTESVFNRCKAVFSTANTWCIDDMSSNNDIKAKYRYARSLFCQDHYLFYYDGTRIIDEFKDMESEFGMIPFPKYDSSQSEYCTLYPHDGYLVAVPKVVEDIERTGKIIEDLNFYSSIIVKPAWYDVLLSRRYTRDEESEEYMKLMYENRVYDLGLIYDFGGLRTNFLEKDARTFDMTERNFKRALRNNVEAYIKQTYREIES